MKITTQKLHKVIQEEVNTLSSLYSPSQKINRNTYDIYIGGNFYGIMTRDCSLMPGICKSLDAAGIKYDDSEINKGFIKLKKFQ